MQNEYVNIVGVQFRKAGKIYDFERGTWDLRVGDDVIVDTERGLSLAKVALVKYVQRTFYDKDALKGIVRKAQGNDLKKEIKITAKQALDFCKKRVQELNLKMRVLKGEVQFGGNKVIMYFSAPQRVDFRELVKELASGLKARVELKQVGARDETKILGGVGVCGREYCCSSFLRDFVPVSIKMAKNQNLALNPTKISGGCGRLLCCLTYENDTYAQLRKMLPPRGAKVSFGDPEEQGDVIKTDILNQIVVVETASGQSVEVKPSDLKIIHRGSFVDEFAEDDSWGKDIDLNELEDELSERKN